MKRLLMKGDNHEELNEAIEEGLFADIEYGDYLWESDDYVPWLLQKWETELIGRCSITGDLEKAGFNENQARELVKMLLRGGKNGRKNIRNRHRKVGKRIISTIRCVRESRV